MAGRGESVSVILARWEMMRADSGWSGLLGGETKISIWRLYRPRVALQGLGPRLRSIDEDGRG